MLLGGLGFPGSPWSDLLTGMHRGLTGLPMLGAIKDADGDRFRNVIVFSGCVLILGSFFIGVARVLKFGGGLRKRV